MFDCFNKHPCGCQKRGHQTMKNLKKSEIHQTIFISISCGFFCLMQDFFPHDNDTDLISLRFKEVVKGFSVD